VLSTSGTFPGQRTREDNISGRKKTVITVNTHGGEASECKEDGQEILMILHCNRDGFISEYDKKFPHYKINS
jgi:hypothetical protein